MRRVPIHADAPRALLRKKGPEGNARKALDKARVKAWRKPVPHVVGRTMKVLTKAEAGAPSSKWCSSASRTGRRSCTACCSGWRTAPTASPGCQRPRYPDPDGVAKTSATIVGDPPAPVAEPACSPSADPQADTPAPNATFSVLQVCTRGDLVCSPKDNSVKAALNVARREPHEGRGARAVRHVARSAWSSTALVPIPSPRSQSISMRLGQPFSAQLVARVKSHHGVLGPTPSGCRRASP